MSSKPQYRLILLSNGTGQLIEQRTGRVVPPGEVRTIRVLRQSGGLLVEFYDKPAVFLMEDEIQQEIQEKAG